jgi:hypothetical protein
MSTPNSGTTGLLVEAADDGTEIELRNGLLKQVAIGAGSLWVPECPPGLYKVIARAGSAWCERLIEFQGTPAGSTHRVQVAELEFASPAPLTNTTGCGEEVRAMAADASHEEGHLLGDGSRLFLFVRGGRNLEEAVGRGLYLSDDHRWLDLTVRPTWFGPAGDEWWMACNFRLDPGVYRLGRVLTNGERVEQALAAALGWQVQVFIDWRPAGPNPDGEVAGADDMAVFYRPADAGFNPAYPTARLEELARLGLATGLRLGAATREDVLAGRFESPMLGLFGGLLELAARSASPSRLKAAANQLTFLLGGAHPDVAAFNWAVKGVITDGSFSVPPMLRQSWMGVVEATVTHARIYPAESTTATVSAPLGGPGPWFRWASRPLMARSADTAWRLVTLVGDIDPATPAGSAESVPPWQAAAARDRLNTLPRPEFSDSRMRRLCLALGLPRPMVERFLDGLYAGPPVLPPPVAVPGEPSRAAEPDAERLIDALRNLEPGEFALVVTVLDLKTPDLVGNSQTEQANSVYRLARRNRTLDQLRDLIRRKWPTLLD